MMEITAIASDPVRGARIVRVENTLSAFKAMIPTAEYIEGHTRSFGGRRLAVYCDDEGRLKGLAPSVIGPDGVEAFVGPVLITRVEHCDDVSMDQDDVGAVLATARVATSLSDGMTHRVLVCDQRSGWPGEVLE